jgi:uncharacterized caspase-like protein
MARTAFIILVFLLWSAVAHAEKRIALVIGNGAYHKVGSLPNPVNDAKAIAGMFQAARFDEVALHENLGIRELRQAIKEFSDLARDADTVALYYSGHGIEVNGINYLIPTDAVLDRDIDVPYEAYSLDNLVQAIEPARRLRLVMLDACRENPFARSMKRTIASRAVGRGLAPVEPTSVNTLIAFAAKAGSIALDGEGANSPYAIALLNNLTTPRLDLRIAFGRVRDDVLKATRNKQEPFVYGSLGGSEIALVSTMAPQQEAPVPGLSFEQRVELDFWASVKDSTSPTVLRTYLHRYPNGEFATVARTLIEHYEQQAKLALAAREEDLRRQNEEKNAAEIRRLEEQRRDRESELTQQRLRAEREKNASEVRRVEELEQTEHAKLSEELKKAQEEARLAREQAKAAEEQRLATVKAAQEAAKAAEEAIATKQQEAAKSDPTTIAALPNIENQSNGDWTISWHCGNRCNVTHCSDSSYVITIRGGTISGGRKSGTVSASGLARWSWIHSRGYGRVTASAMLHGNSGSGRWSNVSGCSGTLTARRH